MWIPRVVRRAEWWAWAACWRALLRWTAPPRVVGRIGGVAVVDTPDAPAAPEAVAVVEAALRLLAEVDPRRFARLARDVDAVAVLAMPTAHDGGFVVGGRTCFLRPPALPGASPARLAVLLAHEATHARLDRLRVVPRGRALRYRMEHRCLREELAFIARLPRERFGDVDGWRARHAAASPYRTPPPRRTPAAARL